MNKWTRRSLLSVGGVVAVCGVAAAAAKTLCHFRFASVPASHPLLSMLDHQQLWNLQQLGQLYLKRSGASAVGSLNRLLRNSTLVMAAQTGCSVTFHTALKKACCADFDHGEIQNIDGWILAQSEVDLAALCTIAESVGLSKARHSTT